MKDASPFEVEGLVKGHLRGAAWHCTFYTPAGRQRRKLGTKNKRQAERRAREIADLVQREDWEALSRRIVLAAAETGMRAGEIRRLKWEDVDLGAGELRVVIAKNKEFRVVPFTERLRAMLRCERAGDHLCLLCGLTSGIFKVFPLKGLGR